MLNGPHQSSHQMNANVRSSLDPTKLDDISECRILT